MANRNTDNETKAAAALAAAERITNDTVLTVATRENTSVVDKKEKVRKGLAAKYIAEKKYVVIGAPMYQAYFGRVMTISMNGIPVCVPLDGNRYEIPESYAQEFNRRIREVNDDIALQKRRSKVEDNFERFPGQLDLVHRV